jgi:hypothetical protein
MPQSGPSPVRVRFVDFWPSFHPDDFFMPLLTKAFPAVSISRGLGLRDRVHLEIRSVFPPRRLPRLAQELALSTLGGARNTRRILYSGEPPLNLPIRADLVLGHEDTDPRTGNVYLPHILAAMDWGDRRRLTEAGRRRGLGIRPETVSQPRSIPFRGRDHFACAFIGRPTPDREKLIAALKRLGPVDVFGAWTGRSVTSKAEVASRYRFMLCPENSLIPGYVTEKVLDSWALGCVPIYGGLDSHQLLNPGAFVDVNGFDSSEGLLDRINDLNTRHDLWEEVAGEQLFRQAPSVDRVVRAIASTVTRAGESDGEWPPSS